MEQKTYTLGFIGIGLMGEPMTLRLLAAGYVVNVWNRSPKKLQAVTEAGATAYSHISELVQSSDIILLCLADSLIVEQIVTEHIT